MKMKIISNYAKPFSICRIKYRHASFLKQCWLKCLILYRDPVAQLEMIESYFSLPNTKLAIRSSARDEDSSGQSQAGLYQSFLNVDLDRNSIQSAIYPSG